MNNYTYFHSNDSNQCTITRTTQTADGKIEHSEKPCDDWEYESPNDRSFVTEVPTFHINIILFRIKMCFEYGEKQQCSYQCISKLV